MINGLSLATLVFALCGLSQNKEYVQYGNYDLQNASIAKPSENGRPGRVDMDLVERVLDDLATHARSYPPRFESQAERIRAERDVKMLAFMFDTIAAEDNVQTDILLKAGSLNSIGHNLDIEGSDHKAVDFFERLLKREPNHALGNFYYGVFLASTAAKQGESLKYLEKAVQLGVKDARFSLGLAHLILGDRAKSIEHLEVYAQEHPNDDQVKRLIEDIKAGKIESKKDEE